MVSVVVSTTVELLAVTELPSELLHGTTVVTATVMVVYTADTLLVCAVALVVMKIVSVAPVAMAGFLGT
jgi:hypothetical protein